MTTFTTRELVRDALVSLFTANATGAGQFQAIYGYFPSVNEILQASPLLIIRARGTAQEFKVQETNPTSYRILFTTMVLAYDGNASPVWTSALAEDKLDDLDRLVRQVVRDNASNANWSVITPEDGFSTVDDVIIGKGSPYLIESRAFIVRLPKGTVS